MKTDEEVKEVVKNRYATIAVSTQSCCGPSCCGTSASSGITIEKDIMGDSYIGIEGYVPEADLGLGCGLPTENAGISVGDTVLDLGSGAGNDVFIARRIVGESGKVIGIDFTDEMLKKANENNEKLGYNNVDFRKGDIDNMPIDSDSVDVVISNCVLNLVPDKKQAFSEIHRVLKTGGHFCVSDIVLNGELPNNLKDAAAMYTGCVAGAIGMDEYLKIISDTGMTGIEIHKKKQILIPDSILLDYISNEELNEFKKSGTEIISITVTANKK